VRGFYGWLRRHPVLVDGLLALAVAALGLTASGIPRSERALFVLAMCVPVAVRRRYPVGAFVAIVIAGGLEVLLLSAPVASDLAVVIMLYTLAAYRPRRVSLPGLAICVAGSMVAIVRWAPDHIVRSLFSLGALVAFFAGPALLAWLLGDSMQWRRGYYRGLEERAARLERERDAQVQVAAAAERARIARELHDVVAHNVSVMVVQADGAAFALDASPDRARQALGAIASTGRQALAEMRSLLGVLRSVDDDAAELTPQPGVEQLVGLLEQARAAGLPVSFAVEGVPRPLLPGVALTAYRIVQESLTNARKHGGPAVNAAVMLRFCEDRLMIKVTNDGLAAGQDGRDQDGADGLGHGLIGMRERVEAYGGTLAAGPRAGREGGMGGGWRVAATLPLSAEPGADGPAAEPGAA
jgi:signal transduction histidine kinase